MPRDILSEYGPGADKKMAPRASSGGVTMKDKRDVLNYQPPYGPTSIGNRKVGLGGYNYGPCGAQGPYPIISKEGGNLGLTGDRPTSGTNRKGR